MLYLLFTISYICAGVNLSEPLLALIQGDGNRRKETWDEGPSSLKRASVSIPRATALNIGNRLSSPTVYG